MATIDDKRQEWALQGLNNVTAPTKQAPRSPAWGEYLGGLTKGLGQMEPAAHYPAAFPTQRRREMEEQARQFDQQMALRRAEAARAAEAAAAQPTKQHMVESVMALVDDQIGQYGAFLKQDPGPFVDAAHALRKATHPSSLANVWGEIEREMFINQGRFPAELSFQEAVAIAADYFFRQTGYNPLKEDAVPSYLRDPLFKQTGYHELGRTAPEGETDARRLYWQPWAG